MNRRLCAALLLSVTLLVPGAARAQSPPPDESAIASQLFRAGAAAFERSDYAAAARAFEESNAHVPRGAALYNAALAWDEAKQIERAADGYAAALARPELEPRDAAEARKRLAVLEPKLGRVAITAPVGGKISIAHAERRAIPVEVHVLPGRYDARVESADGTSVTRSVELAAGATTSIAVDVPPAQRVVIFPPRETARAPAADESDPKLTWGIVGLGAGAVLAGSSVFFGVQALDARDAFVASGETSERAHDQSSTFRTAANVAWISAAVVGAVGAFLLVTSLSESRPVAARPGTTRASSFR